MEGHGKLSEIVNKHHEPIAEQKPLVDDLISSGHYGKSHTDKLLRTALALRYAAIYSNHALTSSMLQAAANNINMRYAPSPVGNPMFATATMPMYGHSAYCPCRYSPYNFQARPAPRPSTPSSTYMQHQDARAAAILAVINVPMCYPPMLSAAAMPPNYASAMSIYNNWHSPLLASQSSSSTLSLSPVGSDHTKVFDRSLSPLLTPTATQNSLSMQSQLPTESAASMVSHESNVAITTSLSAKQ